MRIAVIGTGYVGLVTGTCFAEMGTKSLYFTTDIAEALEDSNIAFIAVGTPMGEDGSADLQYVLSVAKSIGTHMKRHMYVVDKSTVPVGTSEKVRLTIQAELDNRNSSLSFDVKSWIGDRQ